MSVEKIKNTARAGINRIGRLFGTDMMYIVKGSFWMNANYLFVSIVGLSTSILFAHFLSETAYGTYQYVLSIAGLVSALTLTGMNPAVTRSVAQGYEGELVHTTKYQIKLGVIASAVAIAAAIWYAFSHEAGVSLSLIFVALFLPTANALNTWTAYLSGKKDFKGTFYYSLINTIISYGGVILMLCLTRNFVWIALGNFLFGLLGNFVLYFATLRKMKPNDKINPETVPYGTHLSIMAIPGAVSAQLDAILIFYFLGAPALAIYSFATLLPEKISGGLKSISSVALPKFSERNETTVKNFLIKKLWIVLAILIVISGIYALVAPWIFLWLFPTYMASIPYTQIYSLSFFSVGATIVQTALQSQKKTKELYVVNFFVPLIKATLLIILMYLFGIWGVIWAQIITNLVSIVFQMSVF